MKPSYAYYPGCLASLSQKELDVSTRAVAEKLGMELVDIPGFTCCGAGDVHEARPEYYLHLNARILGQAEQLLVVPQHDVRLPQVERADVADREQRVGPGRLGVGEDPRVQVQVVVRLGLVDVAGAAAGDRLEVGELEAELRRERARGRVELLRRERGEAALVVGDLAHQWPARTGSSPGVTSGASRLAAA